MAAEQVVMLIPFILLFMLFIVIPVFLAVILSFTDFDLVQFPSFVGLDNYIRMFLDDDVFLTAFKNTLLFALITGPVSYIACLFLAWLVNELSPKIRSLFTFCLYVPSMFTGAYTVWSYIFSGDQYGFINNMLMKFGFINEPVQWLSDTAYIMPVIIIIQLWLSLGTAFLSFLAGFQGIVFSLSNVVIQTSVNKFNDITVAGNSAASNLEGFVYVSMNAFYQAALTFTGQNYGAGKIKRVNRILGLNLACVTAAGLILGFAATYFGPQLLSLYIEADDPNFAAVISDGMERLKVIMPTYFLCGIMEVCVGMMRGLGYSVTPMIVSLVGACGLRLLWVATVFSMEQYHTLFVLYLSYPVSWAITFAAHLVCYIIIKRKVTRLYNNAVDLPSRYGDAEAL